MKIGSFKLTRDEREVVISSQGLSLNGILGLPRNPKGVILFAHGSGSSRLSIRNNYVARELQKIGMATLLMDLLTEEEEADRGNVFDIDLLAQRLILAKNWLLEQDSTRYLPIGYFGASTGAGAALAAAALSPKNIFAVVSRGGRPDLAAAKLKDVQTPTLLIVGGLDTMVIDLNRQAYGQLRCERKMEIVPGATHLFEEPGTLEQVARLASKWFATQASTYSQHELHP